MLDKLLTTHKDNPRVLTVLLYLANGDAQGGALRVHPPGGSRDVATRAGRMVVFFAQEVLHAVMPSESERRFALTLWIWDVKKDSSGR